MKNDDRPLAQCGAKSKRTGKPCRNYAMRGRRRCRMHGGKSTGPRTTAGRARIGEAHTIHGQRTKAAIAQRRALRGLQCDAHDTILKLRKSNRITQTD